MRLRWLPKRGQHRLEPMLQLLSIWLTHPIEQLGDLSFILLPNPARGRPPFGRDLDLNHATIARIRAPTDQSVCLKRVNQLGDVGGGRAQAVTDFVKWGCT